MTDAPVALPLRMREYFGVYYIFDANNRYFDYISDHARAEYLIRAVNSYAKMREALEEIAYSGALTFQQAAPFARNTLKEIDNGHE